MDHHGQLEKDGSMKSQAHEGGVSLCDDNLLGSTTLTVQTQNLNETNTLIQTQGLPPSGAVEGGRCGLIHRSSPNTNGSREQVGNNDRSGEEKQDDEDTDEVMKEEEEEEESESSCLSHCQSPDTPMTDSSYSETGSLLESSCPFSSGTSQEPSSPTIRMANSVETSQTDADVDPAPTTASITCTDGPASTQGPLCSSTQTTGSATWTSCPAASECITQSTDTVDKMIPCTQLAFECGPSETQVIKGSCAGGVALEVETLVLNTGSTPIITESSSTSGPVPSNLEHSISPPVTTSASVSTCSTSPVPSSALLESLEQLAQRGDDGQLPYYLHQIAEALVIEKDYQRALWCIQLERLYHQRVLDNLNALQEQWESQCRRTSSDLTTQQLDTLKNICQTHTRPRTRDAECRTLDFLRPKFEAANQVEEGMEHGAEGSSKPVIPSINSCERPCSPETSGQDSEDPGSVSGGALAEEAANNGEHEKEEGGAGHTTAVIGNGLHPSTAGGMDQSMSAEQQGQDLDSAQKTETDIKEERDVEVAVEALEMEDDEEEEEEEKEKMERGSIDSSFCKKALPVETLVSGTAVELQVLHQDELCPEKQDNETQLCHKTQESTDVCFEPEPLSHEFNGKQHDPQAEELVEEEEEEEEEEDYDEDVMREAPLLDNMAKLISVEEMSPASGLVSILKKRTVCEDVVSTPTTFEMQPQKGAAKRRVRFKVPDDGFDQDLGSADSCLLLFLLCLVTVVISVGGTALYCAFGDAQSSVCQDFSRNADFYFGQIQHVITQIQHWFALGL